MSSKSVQQRHAFRPQQHCQERKRNFKTDERHLQEDKEFTEQLAIGVKQARVEVSQERRRLWEREWELEHRGFHGGKTCGERERDLTDANIAYGELQKKFWEEHYRWKLLLVIFGLCIFIWIYGYFF
jgi:hypothetical protein